MKKKDATPSGASEWASTPTGRITPMDIQQKEFRVARFGAGYRMREVDEFLDQVTDAMSALVAENERLLSGSGEPGSASSRDPVRPTTDVADRAAVEAFLRREKGFLQDLGGLVQEHAEELRSMVREARQSAPPATAAKQEATVEPATAAAAFQGAPEAPDEPEALQASVDDEDAGTTEQATAATDASPRVALENEGENESEDEGDDEDADEGDEPEVPGRSAMTITEAADDEPIRLDEPEPARSGRQEEKEDGSLRELFWGEE
jgi:DivIVA domain-containing protein